MSETRAKALEKYRPRFFSSYILIGILPALHPFSATGILICGATGILFQIGVTALFNYLEKNLKKDNRTLRVLELYAGSVGRGLKFDLGMHGIQALILPTTDQIRQAKQNISYNPSTFYFAVAGASESEKSSLINAFRGLPNKDIEQSTAPSGTNATTLAVGKHPNRNEPTSQCTVWLDVPVAETESIPSEQYFIQQGLYIFDVIILVYSGRFTEADLGILKNCERFQIPSFIVLTKADIDIQNDLHDQYCPTNDQNKIDSEENNQNGREMLVARSREKVIEELQGAGLKEQRVYVVSNDTLRAAVYAMTQASAQPEGALEEEKLYVDLLSTAAERRCDPEPESTPEPIPTEKLQRKSFFGKKKWKLRVRKCNSIL